MMHLKTLLKVTHACAENAGEYLKTRRGKPANCEAFPLPAVYNTVIIPGKAGESAGFTLSVPLPDILQLSLMTAMGDEINESFFSC